ncbi:hypothetical protein ACOMHN_035996 [Nucella lapillus]
MHTRSRACFCCNRQGRKGKLCDREAKYRSLDGSCNNRRHPLWGAAGQPYLRLIPPHYHDGISLPRLRQINTRLLSSPRDVSSTVFSSECKASSKTTVMLITWGQFIAYDTARTPTEKLKGEKQCCGGMDTSSYKHPDVKKSGPCFPISIPKGDCHFTNTSCMEFVRSRSITDEEGIRQQINAQSAFIDGSTIYGSTKKRSKRLREFLGGDARVNTYPPLGAMHTMFLRYHNHIAGELARVHPDYDEDTLFQEARKIVIAVLQRITLREYMPLLLKRSKISDRLLYANWTYDKRCDPTLYNVIPTAAHRYGHSMVPDFVTVHCDKVALKDIFLRPNAVLTSLDTVVKHAAIERALTVDHLISPGMVNHLLVSAKDPEKDVLHNEPCVIFSGMVNHLLVSAKERGKDVLSINIQRGRDHGLPAYSHWRALCHLPAFTNFSHFRYLGNRFKAVYDRVDDVDLYSAALVEKRVGMLGPTFICLLTKQFEKLRFCDRFWWENKNPLVGFASDRSLQNQNRHNAFRRFVLLVS